MHYAIVVDDPEAFRLATGERWEAGHVYSYGSEIANAKTLAARGLAAVEIGEAPTENQRWDAEARQLVDWEMTKADLAPQIADAEAKLAVLRAAEAVLPDGKGGVRAVDVAEAVAVLADVLRG